MIKLNERLKLMAEQIEKNQTMADIGTDHGFLPMYLLENDMAAKVILADISKGSLDKAKKNMENWAEERKKAGHEVSQNAFEFRLGDGISVLTPGEVDVLVIAGMGGVLISEILGKDIEKTKSFKKLILQPRNGQGKLRYWILSMGFPIEKELLAEEGKFICEIIVVDTQKKYISGAERMPENHISYEIPEGILKNGRIALELIERRLKVENNILEKLLRLGADMSGKNEEKKIRTGERIEYLTELKRRALYD